MLRIILFIFFISVNTLSGQQSKSGDLKMGLYSNLEGNIGFDLGSVLRSDDNKTEYEKQQEDPGRFNYGFSSVVGYQPLKWFAMGGGLRYSYIDPIFIKLNFGRQINSTAIKNTGFVGLSFGKSEVINPHYSHYFQFNLDAQAGDQSVFFVGFSYGIQIFSNKNFNTY